MHLPIVSVIFALGSALFCWTNGAPAGGNEPSESSQNCRQSFSSQEDDFIMEKASPKVLANQKVPWAAIVDDHTIKVNNQDSGFSQKRTASSLRKHFDRYLKHRILSCEKRTTAQMHRRYSAQEEEFINQELLNESFRNKHLYDMDLWRVIVEKHNLKREQKCAGFSKARSVDGLRTHFFLTMRPAHRVSKDVIDRFPENFKKHRASTSRSSSNTNLNEEMHPDLGTDTSENMITESGSEDSEVYDIIMKDLKSLQKSVDDEGIDHDLFVRKDFPRN